MVRGVYKVKFSWNIGDNAVYPESGISMLLRNFVKFLPAWTALIQEDLNFYRFPSYFRNLTLEYRPEEKTCDLVLVGFLWPS